jgi:hypothetical protein
MGLPHQCWSPNMETIMGGMAALSVAARVLMPPWIIAVLHCMAAHGNLPLTEGSSNDVKKVTHNGTVGTIVGIAGYGAFADGEGNRAWFNYSSGIAVNQKVSYM